MPTASFNLIAPFYDWLASFVFGRAIKQAQLKNLIFIPERAQVLIIGGGTGWILSEILQQTNCTRIVYLESSEKMLSQARQHLTKNKPRETIIELRLGTEDHLDSTEKFNVVITNFFLDLFAPAPLKYITDKLFKVLTPGGFWLVTDFVQPKSNVTKTWSKLLYKSMYLFFRLTCNINATSLPDWENLLQSYSLKSGESWYFYHGLIKSVVLQRTPSTIK